MPNDELIEKQTYELALELREDLEKELNANDNIMAKIIKEFPNAATETNQEAF